MLTLAKSKPNSFFSILDISHSLSFDIKLLYCWLLTELQSHHQMIDQVWVSLCFWVQNSIHTFQTHLSHLFTPHLNWEGYWLGYKWKSEFYKVKNRKSAKGPSIPTNPCTTWGGFQGQWRQPYLNKCHHEAISNTQKRGLQCRKWFFPSFHTSIRLMVLFFHFLMIHLFFSVCIAACLASGRDSSAHPAQPFSIFSPPYLGYTPVRKPVLTLPGGERVDEQSEWLNEITGQMTGVPHPSLSV